MFQRFICTPCHLKLDNTGAGVIEVYPSLLSLHKIVHFLKDKIGVVYFQCCVIFDTL